MGVSVTSRKLEITVLSGENVIHATNEAYVVVRGESLNSYTTRAVKDNNGGNNNSSFLSWNEKFLLDMPLHARSITFEVQCKKFKGVRPVGVARIAVSDILPGGYVPENSLRVLSYRLRDWEGKLNGVIHFGVRVVQQEDCVISVVEMKKETVASVKDCSVQLTGIHACDRNSNGVVTGFPLWWNYQNIV